MRRLIHILVLCTSLVVLGACQNMPGPVVPPQTILPSGVTIVHNGTVIDGTGAAPIPEGLVAIQDGTIINVGPETQFVVPDNAQVLDAKGGTILPGIIDAHTHILENAGSTLALALWLQHGVTTVRDLGSRYGTGEVPSLNIAALKRRLAEAGNTIPTVVVAGPIVTAPGGYPVPVWGSRLALQVANVKEARQAATRLLVAGADGLKIALTEGPTPHPWPTLTPEQVATITQVAHAHGTWVSVHVTRTSDADIAVANGVDDLAHLPVDTMSDELIQQMIVRDVLLVPTLVVEDGFRIHAHYPEDEWERVLKMRQDNIHRFLSAGGRVALGSDYGNPGIPPGMPVSEMQRMLDTGMTPMQVIVAATQHAAQACGLGDRLGTLEAGKQGDVIAIDGNPLRDMQVMGDVIIVIKAGEVIVQP